MSLYEPHATLNNTGINMYQYDLTMLDPHPDIIVQGLNPEATVQLGVVLESSVARYNVNRE